MLDIHGICAGPVRSHSNKSRPWNLLIRFLDHPRGISNRQLVRDSTDSQSSQSIGWLSFADICFLSDLPAIVILTLLEASLTCLTRYHQAQTTWRLQRHDLILLFQWTLISALYSYLVAGSATKAYVFVFFGFSWRALLCMAYRWLSLLRLVFWPGSSSFFCLLGMLNREHT